MSDTPTQRVRRELFHVSVKPELISCFQFKTDEGHRMNLRPSKLSNKAGERKTLART
jgi:hypothetical protein